MTVRAIHKTVRFRITAVAVVAVAAVLVTTAIVLVQVQRNGLYSSLDRSLERSLAQLETQVLAAGVPERLPGELDDDRFAEIRVGGELVASTARAPDDPYRTTSATVETDLGPVEIVVGEATDDIAETIASLRVSLLVAVLAVLAVLGALVWWLVGRTLRPVESIRSEVAGIGAGALDHRITEPASGDEIADLSQTMNQMLGRIEQSVRRQERFVADASHELRSPLTRIRTELEVDIAQPATADLAATHRSVLEETIMLQDTIDELLYLARVDSGVDSRQAQLIDLDDIVREEASRLSEESEVLVDQTGVSAALVRGDRARLRRAVRNLLTNAARHAESVVVLRLAETDHTVVLTVDDDGPGIAPDDRERVFERFTRLDDARARDAGGTGLGLAITREIVTAHGGSVAVAESPAGGARLVVTLPLETPEAG